ncbi:hypothetical protein UCRPA7_6477 [Phaeoacremonium minimum UCRPA7]|uniref:Uncharacterized protein n=1 Tax=Phaeoacremonium minimum (strain UCR-PA7) TaxID=1286976 RepID=R8BFD9_PHAM7|nr:hypothetical protein UCRPA7_6477 [Phaeoacremonium minimum UCRPA7]EON98015.1 hypothetical protein UCRPA7_6477 [Phaeoacremonium minimum UCRPA7]
MANPAAVNANSQIDINALLGNLKNAAGTNGPPSQMPTGHEYAAAGYAQPPGGSMPPTGNGAMPGGADPSAQVATIMQQLARFRQ